MKSNVLFLGFIWLFILIVISKVIDKFSEKNLVNIWIKRLKELYFDFWIDVFKEILVLIFNLLSLIREILDSLKRKDN